MEKEIIQRLRQGTPESYKYIYQKYYALLCHIASEYLHDDFLAETIVSDLIFHLWEHRESLEIHTSLRSYLITSVRNRCLDHLDLKRNKVEVPFSTISDDEDYVSTYIIDDGYPLDSLFTEELEQILQDSIRNLPPESKNVFLLSRFQQKKYEEISEELDISINTVKYHIKQALKLIHNSLDKYLIPLILILFDS